MTIRCVPRPRRPRLTTRSLALTRSHRFREANDNQAIHHCGLVVRDLDRSIYFYHDLLGLPFANEPTAVVPARRWRLESGCPGRRCARSSLWAGEHSMMELIEYGNRPASSTSSVPNNYLGAAHVCFQRRGRAGDARPSWRPRACSSTPTSTSSTRDRWPGGGGCTSAIPTASPSSSSRSPTTSRRSARRASAAYLRPTVPRSSPTRSDDLRLEDDASRPGSAPSAPNSVDWESASTWTGSARERLARLQASSRRRRSAPC